MNRWQAVVFDLDDTLYPEHAYVASGFRAVAEWIEQRFGFDAQTVYADFWTMFSEGVRGDIFNRWLEKQGIADTEIVSEFVRVYRGHEPEIAPYPEALSVLSALRALGIRLGLLSDGYLEVQRRKLKALGIQHFFEAVTFSDELGREHWKPSPVPFLVTLARLRVAPTSTVYVADNPLKDFLGARHVGIYTVRLRLLEGIYSALDPPTDAHRPDIEINDYTELRRILLGDAL